MWIYFNPAVLNSEKFGYSIQSQDFISTFSKGKTLSEVHILKFKKNGFQIFDEKDNSFHVQNEEMNTVLGSNEFVLMIESEIRIY